MAYDYGNVEHEGAFSTGNTYQRNNRVFKDYP